MRRRLVLCKDAQSAIRLLPREVARVLALCEVDQRGGTARIVDRLLVPLRLVCC